jgi:hypothetical protein
MEKRYLEEKEKKNGCPAYWNDLNGGRKLTRVGTSANRTGRVHPTLVFGAIYRKFSLKCLQIS